MAPFAASGSNSSDYFDQYEPEFLDSLQNTVLPGDLPASSPESESESEEELEPPPPSQPGLKRRHRENEDQYKKDDEVYGPSHFGDFGEYMRRKRAKLQIQNTEMAESDSKPTENNAFFRGLSIYVSRRHACSRHPIYLYNIQINGLTVPSVQDLRALIVRHGGVFQAYLVKKSLVSVDCSWIIFWQLKFMIFSELTS